MKRLISLLLTALLLCAALPMLSSVAADEDAPVKNVIFMIGDGMGWNHLELAKQERGVSLFMEDECDVRGWSKTRSVSNTVTDSAAGGTALSSGVRTNNRYVGSYWYDPLCWFSVPRTLNEAALLSGRRSGVVTSDKTDGATPASFTAHTNDRDNSEDITTQQMHSDFDLIWGAASSTFSAEEAEANGFTVVTSAKEMKALEPGTKSFGQFDSTYTWRVAENAEESHPTLSAMTEKAISLLDCEEGFFLMVEGAHIDKHSHNNNAANAAEALEEFDRSIRIAAKFARADGNTLVVITADHETGGLQLIDGKYTYTKTSHSNADVPVIVFGSDKIIGADEHIENYRVSRRVGKAMGLGGLFPHADPGKIAAVFAKVEDWFRSVFTR